MKKLIIANWKMNPRTVEEARRLITSIEHRMHTVSKHAEVAVCAPFVYLPALSHYTGEVKLGAQNISWADSGSLTGEISAPQVCQWNVYFAILGHSERRLYLGETDSTVNLKIKVALKNKITPVVCLGSKSGAKKEEMKQVVARQLRAVTKNLEKSQLEKIIYVYEPTWAISTMENSTPATGEHANDVIVYIQGFLARHLGKKEHNVRVLYGGTVNKNNVYEYAKYPAIGGALVGAASLDPQNFWEIIKEFSREAIHV